LPTYGILSTGFNIKPLSAILADIQAVELSEISTALNIQADSIIGVLNGIVAQAAFDEWQALNALYNGMDPDQATDDQLTSLALITGTAREAATKTQVLQCTLSLNNTFADAPPGTLVAAVAGNPAAQFTNKTTVSYPGGSPPQNVSVDFEALDTGPIQCLSGTLTIIAQPVTGWNSITNPTDGAVGSDIENDASLRIHRNEELSTSGAATAAAIKADVLTQMQPPTTTSETTSVTVLYNDTATTDSNGLPAGSIEVIARQVGATADDDLALATLILNSKSAGIETYGTDNKLVTDPQGNSETVYFTRPTDTDIYIDITVVADPNASPPVSADGVKAALIAYGNLTYQPGVEVYAKALEASVFPSPSDPNIGVVGVLDVTSFFLDTTPSPVVSVNIPIDVRHVAVLDTSRITVTIT